MRTVGDVSAYVLLFAAARRPTTKEKPMFLNALIVRRLVGTAFVAAVASTTLVGFATTGQAQAVGVAAPMAKCIPGTGNPMNPCPWP